MRVFLTVMVILLISAPRLRRAEPRIDGGDVPYVLLDRIATAHHLCGTLHRPRNLDLVAP